jgi:hypothetical protein
MRTHVVSVGKEMRSPTAPVKTSQFSSIDGVGRGVIACGNVIHSKLAKWEIAIEAGDVPKMLFVESSPIKVAENAFDGDENTQPITVKWRFETSPRENSRVFPLKTHCLTAKASVSAYMMLRDGWPRLP